MKAQHTPGPWKANGTHITHQTNPGGYRFDIAEVFRDVGSQPAKANAVLIAQAPAMLATLQSCFEMLNSPKFSSWIEANCADDELWAMTSAMVQRREDIALIIAKATEAKV